MKNSPALSSVKKSEKKSGCIWRIFQLGGIGLIGLVVLGGLLSFFADDERQPSVSQQNTPTLPTATQTATPAPTDTPVLPTATAAPTDTTATPMPTDTPVPPTATPMPTDTPVPPTATPMPTDTPVPPTATAAPASLQSRGLGLTQAEWEKTYGEGQFDGMGYLYNPGMFDVTYWVIFYEGKVQHIELSWAKPVSIDFVAGFAKPLLPKDGVLIETYFPDSDKIVDLYHSDSLAVAYPDALWIGGQPGDFILLHRVVGGEISSAIIATGNNP